MNKRTLEQGISDIKELFDDALKTGNWKDYASGNQSFFVDKDNEFFIDKRVCERDVVISRLVSYFDQNEIVGHCVVLDSITLLFTTFKIAEL